ncbi:MAG: triose-phosphate isomerase [Clostridium sp.]|nr:triose-phosphate isomerase [Clostridium sp.]
MSRRPVIAGNWKMHKLQSESAQLVNDLMKELKDMDKATMPEVVVAPVFTSLYAVNKAMTDCGCGRVKLAAQNAYFETEGAFTGEVSVEMVKDAGAEYVIIGHSERRQYFGETDEMINKKAKKILSLGLVPIICCGESLEQRESGVTDSHIASQIKAALDGLTSEEVAKSIIAYEPIWAIGTGKTCDSVEANRVIAMIRNVVKEIAGEQSADAIRILYGGSVKPATIAEQMAQSDIDGALVGGASLKADSFAQIVKGAM